MKAIIIIATIVLSCNSSKRTFTYNYVPVTFVTADGRVVTVPWKYCDTVWLKGNNVPIQKQ